MKPAIVQGSARTAEGSQLTAVGNTFFSKRDGNKLMRIYHEGWREKTYISEWYPIVFLFSMLDRQRFTFKALSSCTS